MPTLSLELIGLEPKDGQLPGDVVYDAAALRRAPLDWDHVARVTCRNNCGNQRGCSFYAYAKDGIVLRQELVGDYLPFNDPAVPDPIWEAPET